MATATKPHVAGHAALAPLASLEQTWVPEGHVGDRRGPDQGIECKAGQFIWRPAGSRHSAWSPNGGLMPAFFQIPNKFFATDGRVTDTAGADGDAVWGAAKSREGDVAR
jgi:hypothetical protein